MAKRSQRGGDGMDDQMVKTFKWIGIIILLGCIAGIIYAIVKKHESDSNAAAAAAPQTFYNYATPMMHAKQMMQSKAKALAREI